MHNNIMHIMHVIHCYNYVTICYSLTTTLLTSLPHTIDLLCRPSIHRFKLALVCIICGKVMWMYEEVLFSGPLEFY